jgi:hypothetical protein
MAEVINLRRARKAKSRADAERQAAANWAKFGQSRSERNRHALERDRTDRSIDGAKREPE